MFFLMPRKPDCSPVQQLEQSTTQPVTAKNAGLRAAKVAQRLLVGAVVSAALVAVGYTVVELSSGFGAMPTCGRKL
ncbi:MAG: hypothetical protein RMI89_05895 [Gloeomargarita sp. SKYBB_i_bin120]|nr:hypothetical protein [Gloeomargarita sp. SKYG98]MCS7292497.1 hypothetical protein [Gloeomargarita sp. SKYB120]MDW8178058.1 hypothetical protein [Gloeomargarita sp. SKYBB_i_bin120]